MDKNASHVPSFAHSSLGCPQLYYGSDLERHVSSTIGVVNAMLEGIGVEGISWFSQFSTAFCANLVTNTWLGFPFMMVVTLGALQSIPRDLEQAAEIDGASGWQRFGISPYPC